GLIVDPEHLVTVRQIDQLITCAMLAAERFYPAFMLVVSGKQTPAETFKVAIQEAYGRA
ncbi:MAG: hypothetical protein RLZZ70_204, partial [Candidatus Parcubacteria bacterium]